MGFSAVLKLLYLIKLNHESHDQPVTTGRKDEDDDDRKWK